MQVTKTASFSLSRTSLALLAAATLLSTTAARADQTAVLMDGPVHRITAADVQADGLRMPEDARAIILAQPQRVEQIVTNLYVRRALADEATKQGLAKQADVQAALVVAHDKVLSDAWIQMMQERHKLSDQLAEAQARNLYNAKPERFELPEQVKVSHILIAGDTPEAKTQAEELLAQLKSGANFAELAKQKSADKSNAGKGGDLGYFARGRMVPEFDKAAFALEKPGALDLVKTQFGYHILKLDARRPAGVQPYTEVRDELLKEVRAAAVQTAISAEADKLMATGTVRTEAIQAFSEGVKKQ